jgi:hypothetical protein
VAQFFSDNQIRRFLIQIGRVFSNFEVSNGTDASGNPITIRVPVRYGDASRQAATIIANNSAASLPSAPMFTYYIENMEYARDRVQDPYFVHNLDVRQRYFNTETQEYETTQGSAFTVERLMPVPYNLRVKVDLWTTNADQRLQLVEQIAPIFNPSLEIQSTDNFIDWTALTVMELIGFNLTSRTIPQGTGNPIDITTWTFNIPMWISSPIKVKKLGVIHRIIANVFQGSALTDMQDDDILLGTRQKITPWGYQVLLADNTLQILPESQPKYIPNSNLELPDAPNTDISWQAVLNAYGVVRPGISMITLEHPDMDTEIMGTIAFNPNDDRLLVYNVIEESLPQNTMLPVDSVIDPIKKYPGENLPLPAIGQRYLIVGDIPQQRDFPNPSTLEPAWVGLENGAKANDIIEYGVNGWAIAFDSDGLHDQQFVKNLTSGLQYRWIMGQGWAKSIEGFYAGGDWRVVI